MEKKYSKLRLALVVLGVIILIILGMLVTSCVQNSGFEPSLPGEKIKIGFIIPKSGEAAGYGLNILKGAQLAVKEMQLDNIQLLVEDSQCNEDKAKEAANKLINTDQVQALIGDVCPSATLAISTLAEQNKIALVSPASTSPKISDAGEYTFRTIPSDALQGAFGAQLVFNKGYKKLAILYSNEEYGLGFSKVLENEFPKLGGRIVASESFPRGSRDLRQPLLNIRQANPDAVYIITNSPDSAAAALKISKEMGIRAALFGSESLKSAEVLKNAENSAEGLTLTTISSGNVGFLTKYKAEYNQEPGPFAAQAYDAFKAIALAIQQGASSGEEIKENLINTNFKGASGQIQFDSQGDVAGNYDIFVVRDGAFVPE